ncbi:MAG: hypothetical protein CL596_00430 [Alteromonas sp.]|nr:hypothetical protein [Alteromonas sp.]MAY22060.1 hypothetical protein [Flavobacteriaceae bacterium]|tara:strand:- start:122 stop:826 length:705 start_codon:yes stop_codon:yes gene_type:complete
MEVQWFLLLQFLAHIIADYFFQTDALAEDKNNLGFKSKFLVWHILMVFVFSWLLSLQIEFFIGSGIIAIFHYLIDGFKPKLNRHKTLGKYAFFIDQLMHLLVLTAVTLWFDAYYGWDPLWEIPVSFKTGVTVVAFLLTLKPTNIFIKQVFCAAEVQMISDNELPNAGKLIGILERILTLTFIIIGQFQAVGFLIAAKSVLRYKDTETLKTEYVLIGTMLSFGVAVLLGIFINSL